MSIELGKGSQLAIQARQPVEASTTSFIAREKPVMEISSSRYRGSGRPPLTPRGLTRGSGRGTNNNSRAPTHNCRNCGQPLDCNRAKCQATGQTCRRYNDQNHYAKVGRSNLNRQQSHRSVNEVDNQESINRHKE